jgi:hypothetical protein
MKKYFKKVINKLAEWHNAGVLPFALFISCLIPILKLDIDMVSIAIRTKKLEKLRKRYGLGGNVTAADNLNTSRRVWIFWYQGFESAPPIVKKCAESVIAHVKDREVVLLDKDNMDKYAKFPLFIMDRLNKGQMSITHFSDLLRLELLIRHGGTWMDATCYLSDTPPDYILDSDLFMFQRVSKCFFPTRVSNGYISAKAGNNLLGHVQGNLYRFWKEHNRISDYFLFHLFFELAIIAYPDEWNRVKPVFNGYPHMMQSWLCEKFDKDVWDNICEQTSVHKLNHKLNWATRAKDSFYDYIVGEKECG